MPTRSTYFFVFSSAVPSQVNPSTVADVQFGSRCHWRRMDSSSPGSRKGLLRTRYCWLLPVDVGPLLELAAPPLPPGPTMPPLPLKSTPEPPSPTPTTPPPPPPLSTR